jgi:uncharacterized membrane protein YeaQ/YmgE (transglycosylase-associated protein family)
MAINNIGGVVVDAGRLPVKDNDTPIEEIAMSFLTWIVLGLIAGFVASKIVNKQGSGVLVDILLGIVGALVGGWLFVLLGGVGVSGVNIHSLIVAVIGAIAVLLVYHGIRRGV